MDKHPPKNLPEGYRDIWTAVSEADEAEVSRQTLAAKLRISTHTIQRILVDGDVPDFSNPVSRRILNSWTRTITRLALHFGRDPLEWVKMVGIDPEDRIMEIIETVRSGPFSTPVPDSDGSFFENLGRKMFDVIIPELKKKNLFQDEWLANPETDSGKSVKLQDETDDKQLTTGNYCQSCLAPLDNEHNRGVSDVYCCYCSDENGNLLPREKVLLIIAEWFMQWQMNLTESEARRRADLYMCSMPAWNQTSQISE